MKKSESIRAIASKKASELTEKDRRMVEKVSQEMGLKFEPKGDCPLCYIGQAVEIWKAMQNDEAAKQPEPAYILKEGVDIIYRGVRLNAATLTDEKAADALAHGLDPVFFAKWK